MAKLERASRNPCSVEICYIHRGAPNNEVRIMVSEIEKLGKGWFSLADGETQIPYHRVIWVRDVATAKTFWEKRYPRIASTQRR